MSSRWDLAEPANMLATPLRSMPPQSPFMNNNSSVNLATPVRDPSRASNWDRSVRTEKLLATPSTLHGNADSVTVQSYFGSQNGSERSRRPLITATTFAQMTSEQQSVVKPSFIGVDPRNKYMTDDELNDLLPKTGYEIVKPPADYKPQRVTRDFLSANNAPSDYASTKSGQKAGGQGGTEMSTTNLHSGGGKSLFISERTSEDMPAMREDDLAYFGSLLKEESELTTFELRERKVLTLLLKIKNGTPPIRKNAMKLLSEKSREFGPDLLFNQLLPLLMSPTIDEWERHLMVKVLDRVMFRLEDLVRPYASKILVIVSPMLTDEDNYIRSEGRELIANLAKAVGLPTMITTLRPDIDHKDDMIRNTTARVFSVVAGALGVPALLPFLKAVCSSKKSWQARNTGCKIIQQIAILLGCGVLPHLNALVATLKACLTDEQQKVRVTSALAISSLAEASAPFGIEAFDIVLENLWAGLNAHRGKPLAAFLRAVGSLIPLMDDDHAGEYIRLVMHVLLKEFESPEDEMKRILLRVIKQCIDTKSIDASYIREKISPNFWENFWLRKLVLDRLVTAQLVDTTVSMAKKIGTKEVITHLIGYLKEDHEALRKAAMDAIVKIVKEVGTSEFDHNFEEILVDAAMFAFHQQINDDSNFMLKGFTAIVSSLGFRAKRFLAGIVANICVRLKTRSPKIRQQAADLVSGLALVLSECDEERLLSTLSQMLYENLGEEFPEVLGSILNGLKAIVNVIGMNRMVPSIKDLLPSLTPILQNRHEKVQEQLVDLIGRIADRGAEHVNPKEWIRICFDLIDLLKADRKSIRRATVNTFGYIAKAIGPQDVLITLINNLKVQDRQMRICTTVAIAIVAEACGPFTVIPALMNEYRVPSNNIQNGILKSFAFMFEYICEMAKDYIYAVTPMLEDALLDRDLVHRQTAATALKHMSLGVIGFGCEDALIHLFNHVLANLFETSPHVINAVTEAFESLRLSVGPGFMLLYILQGLFHPAKRVRCVYWRLYNLLYIGAQDALTPFYPILPNYENSDNDFTPHEGLFYQL